MRRMIRFATLSVLILAVALVASALVGPSPHGSPYLSALSELAATATLAAPGCNNKSCQSMTCQRNKGTNCVGGAPLKCSSYAC